jgi:hypothetical protein
MFPGHATEIAAAALSWFALACGGDLLLGSTAAPDAGSAEGASGFKIDALASDENTAGGEGAPAGDESLGGAADGSISNSEDSAGIGPVDSSDDVESLPLCTCTPGFSEQCVATSSCRVPSCPVVAGGSCCTPAGLCGCKVSIPAGPILSCN